MQTLFTFRGADVRGLLDFRQRHQTGRAVTLDHSHRATRHLVELANALSDLLAYRSGLVTDNPAGPAARLLQADDEHAEAEFIANQSGRSSTAACWSIPAMRQCCTAPALK